MTIKTSVHNGFGGNPTSCAMLTKKQINEICDVLGINGREFMALNERDGAGCNDWRARALTAEARLAELLDEQSRRLHDAFERRTSSMEQLTGDDARKVIR